MMPLFPPVLNFVILTDKNTEKYTKQELWGGGRDSHKGEYFLFTEISFGRNFNSVHRKYSPLLYYYWVRICQPIRRGEFLTSQLYNVLTDTDWTQRLQFRCILGHISKIVAYKRIRRTPGSSFDHFCYWNSCMYCPRS